MIFLCNDYEQLYKLCVLYLFLFSYFQYVLVNKANSVHNLFLVYLRINCAPSWLYLQEYTGMHSQQNIKRSVWLYCEGSRECKYVPLCSVISMWQYIGTFTSEKYKRLSYARTTDIFYRLGPIW